MGTKERKAPERVVRPAHRGPADTSVRRRHGTEPRESRVRNGEPSDARGDSPAVPLQQVPLLVSGVSDADLDGQLPAARRVKVRGLRLALRSRDPPFVVVLGDEALQRLSPSVVGRFLKRPGCIAFGYARTCPAHVVADWARRCPIEFVPEGRLSRRIAVACRLGGAVLSDEEASTGPGRRAEMRRALLVLKETGDFQVKTWAAAFGKSRHALKRLFHSTPGLHPEEIAWAFFDTRVRREVFHGRSDKEVAVSVGMASAYDLRRAYTRRGLPFPGT